MERPEDEERRGEGMRGGEARGGEEERRDQEERGLRRDWRGGERMMVELRKGSE